MNLLSSLAAEPALWAAVPLIVVLAVVMVAGALEGQPEPVPVKIRRRR